MTTLDIIDHYHDTFERFFEPFAPHFRRRETRDSARLYLRGLLSEASHKNVWQLAQQVGLSNPHPLQRLLNEANWEADDLSQQMRQLIYDNEDTMLGIAVIAEYDFPKKGQRSVGVTRQYSERMGRLQNSQVGIFLGYVCSDEAVLIDRHLYLPPDWCEDMTRRQAAHIPPHLTWRSKIHIAEHLLCRARSEGLAIGWVTGGIPYGSQIAFREFIHHLGLCYVLAISSHAKLMTVNERQSIPLSQLAMQAIDHEGEKVGVLGKHGLLWYEWFRLRVRTLHQQEDEQWLLISRTLEVNPYYSFYLSNAPCDTPLLDLVEVANARVTNQEALQTAHEKLGLGDYEVRHWHGWHRHMSLVMLAMLWVQMMGRRF